MAGEEFLMGMVGVHRAAAETVLAEVEKDPGVVGKVLDVVEEDLDVAEAFLRAEV
jgi:hypothetical protein